MNGNGDGKDLNRKERQERKGWFSEKKAWAFFALLASFAVNAVAFAAQPGTLNLEL
jgi:hypothetical protein